MCIRDRVKGVSSPDSLILPKRLHRHLTGIESSVALAKWFAAATSTEVQSIVVDAVAAAESVLVVSEPSEVETREKLSPVFLQTGILALVRCNGNGSTGTS